MIFAIVNSNNIVENVIVWDGFTEWSPCHTDDKIIDVTNGVSVQSGDQYNEDNTFTRNTVVEE